MKINKIISQNRRDFTAEYICEHCGATKVSSGYDDTFFHQQVIPEMKCDKCNLTSGDDYRPLTTKYNDSEVV